jgi:pimeloyl-ACP methyl ester carboxylesterase
MSGEQNLTLSDPEHRIQVRSADGTRLNIESFGPDDGRTVVLAHGWTCSIAFWTKQVTKLIRNDVRVIAYDQRGHGSSGAAGPAGHTPEALADDLSAVLNSPLVRGRKVVVAGHSMGAMTLIAFGARHPQQLRRQISAALLASTGMNELVVRARIVPLPLPLAKLARPVITRLMGLSPAGTKPNRWQRTVTRYSALSSGASEADVLFCTTLIGSCPPATRVAFARMLSALDLDDAVREFDVPTIVVAGTHDRLTPIWHARRLADSLPRLLEFVEIEGSGHMTPVQSATEVNSAFHRLVRDYLPPQVDGSEHLVGTESSAAAPDGVQIRLTDGSIDLNQIPDTAQETA